MDNQKVQKVPIEFYEELRKWLGKDGCRFFKHLYGLFGEISPVIKLNRQKRHMPVHCVHFREGMQIRNFMRDTGYFSDWDCHDLDNNWAHLTKIAIFGEENDSKS